MNTSVTQPNWSSKASPGTSSIQVTPMTAPLSTPTSMFNTSFAQLATCHNSTSVVDTQPPLRTPGSYAPPSWWDTPASQFTWIQIESVQFTFSKPRTFIQRDSNTRIDIKLLAVDFVIHLFLTVGSKLFVLSMKCRSPDVQLPVWSVWVFVGRQTNRDW